MPSGGDCLLCVELRELRRFGGFSRSDQVLHYPDQ